MTQYRLAAAQEQGSTQHWPLPGAAFMAAYQAGTPYLRQSESGGAPITSEMIKAGMEAWLHLTTRPPGAACQTIVASIYRAMRALKCRTADERARVR